MMYLQPEAQAHHRGRQAFSERSALQQAARMGMQHWVQHRL